MSTILKALKKLEEEKSRRQEGGGDLSRDILLGETQRQRAAVWPLVAVGGGLMLLASGVLYFSLRGDRLQSSVTSSPAAVAKEETDRAVSRTAVEDVTVERVQAVPIAAVPAPETVSSASDSAAPATSASPVERNPATAAAETASPVLVEPPAGSRPAEDPSSDRVFSKTEPTSAISEKGSPPPQVQASASREEPSLPELRVSGIAFQGKREARMAIVNGLPVMEGTNMAGAWVEEILADRVRFTFNGRSFEVLLDEL